MATAVQATLYSQSQRAYHQLGLSILLNLGLPTPADIPAPLPGQLDDRSRANLHHPRRPHVNLYLDNYNSIQDLGQSSASTNSALGLSFFVPLQGQNERLEPMNGILPMISGGTSYESASGHNSSIDASSASLPSPYIISASCGVRSGLWSGTSPAGYSPSALTGLLPGPNAEDLRAMYSKDTNSDATNHPSAQSSCMFVNPWELSNGLAHRDNIRTSSLPPHSSLLRDSDPTFTAVHDPSILQHRPLSVPRSTSTFPEENDSTDGLDAKNELVGHGLTAEEMANEEELAELRRLEEGGASRRADRRRMRNKLAQRAFRARAKMTKQKAASRLVQMEASNMSQDKELDLLRTMVHTLQNENNQLKRQINESNNQRRMSLEGSETLGQVVKVERQAQPRSRKRSRETV